MKNAKRLIGLGMASVLLLLGSIWYSITYNQSRLVVPMDFSTYVFQLRDLPMLLSVLLIFLYACYLSIRLVITIFRNSKTATMRQTTRRLSPKWGLFGFTGLLGFLGFWTYAVDQTVFPFCFFMFFGFFGFFFEGKMSNTYMDERFRENAQKAQLTALKIGFVILIVSLFLFGQGRLFSNLEYTAVALIISLSAVLGLVLFLCEYLLYRYDHEEPVAEEEEEDG